tara:strand:+ start:46611 stop:47639 length:1029 start_codon:yes stop_codon:yes gene_type:complete
MRVRNRPLLAALCTLGLWQGAASAQPTPKANEQAEELNAQGKKLIKQLDLAGAAQRFRAALALSNDPRFAFNLCYTLEKSGQLVEAKQACETVMASGDSRLSEKANRLLAVIEESLADGEPKPPPAPPGPGGSLRQPPPTQPVKPVPVAKPAPSTATPEKKARSSYGVMAGLSRANMQTTFGDPEAKVGLAFGGGMRLRISPSFESIVDAQFVQRGFQDSSDGIDPIDAELTSNYLDVGFASRWYLSEEAFQPYAEVGMALSILLFSSATLNGQDVDVDVQPFDVSYALGLGSRIAIGSRSLDIRLRYMYGLLNTSNSDSGVGGTDTTGFNRTLLIQTGIWL